MFYFLESSFTSVSAFSELTNDIGKPQREDHFLKKCFESKQYSQKYNRHPIKCNIKLSSLTFPVIDLLFFPDTLLPKLWPWCSGDSYFKKISSTPEFSLIVLSILKTNIKLPCIYRLLHPTRCPFFMLYVMNVL